MDGRDIFSAIIIVYGIVLLLGIVVKPKFFWESRRMMRRRELIGEQGTIRMYWILSVMMILVGGADILGFF